MGKTIRASVLVLLIASSAQAGYMQNDVKQPPPPPNTTQAASAGGEMQDGASAGLAETVLSVLESLLSLL